MANYNKGGEIFIDLGGINVETLASSNTVTVNGIHSRLETAFNLGKRVVITNYISRYGNHPSQNGVPVSVTVYRPTTANAFFIPVLSYTGITILSITSSNVVNVYKLYAYHNIYTPPETTTNNARNIDETIEETEKGEESK